MTEHEILELVAQGRNNDAIARSLTLSAKTGVTVKNCVITGAVNGSI